MGGGPEDAKVVCDFTQHGLLLCIICELIHLSCLSLAFPDLQLLAMLLHQVILGLTRTVYTHRVFGSFSAKTPYAYTVYEWFWLTLSNLYQASYLCLKSPPQQTVACFGCYCCIHQGLCGQDHLLLCCFCCCSAAALLFLAVCTYLNHQSPCPSWHV